MTAETDSRRVWIIGAVVGVVALMILAVWFGHPAWRQYKERRALNHAREFLQENDYRNAVLSIRQVLQINPRNSEAVRLMADLASEAQSPIALGWRQRAVELAPTVENRILLVATALRVEQPPFPIAAHALKDLEATPGIETNTTYHLAASQYALRLDRLEDGESHLQAAARLDPTNQLHKLNIATIHLQSPDPNVAQGARKVLLECSSDPELGGPALRSLIADALLREKPDEARRLSEQLIQSPSAVFEDRLQHLTVLNAAGDAGEVKTQLEQLRADAGTNVVQIAQIAGWMLGNDRARDVIDWLGSLPETVLGTPPVPIIEADAFMALQDWEGLETFLQNQQWGDQDFLRLAMMTRSLREQGRRELANANWRRVTAAVSSRPEAIGALIQLTARWGWEDEVVQFLWKLADASPRNDWPLQALFNHYSATTNTLGLYRVHVVLLERHPDSLALKNNVAMYAMLLEKDPARASDLAREVATAEPTNAVFVSTYALALYREGKSDEGLQLLQQLPETELRRPEIATYYAVLLSATGDQEQARNYSVLVDRATLLPEERTLLSKAIQ